MSEKFWYSDTQRQRLEGQLVEQCLKRELQGLKMKVGIEKPPKE